MVAGLIGAAVFARPQVGLIFPFIDRRKHRIRKPVVVPWIGLCEPIVRRIFAPTCHAHPLVCLDPSQYSDFLQDDQEEMTGPSERYGG